MNRQGFISSHMRFIQRFGAVARLVRSQTQPVTLPVLQLCGGSAYRAGGIGAAAAIRVNARPSIPCRVRSLLPH